MFLADEVEVAQHLQGQARMLRASRMCTHLYSVLREPLTVDSGAF